MASSSSSPPPPNPQPHHPSSRRLPPPCWTHEETIALIDAYRRKWYSLNRGNLKAPHWQEVADSVARTCPHVLPPKTSLQCRHKIEKLRKRYRNEKQRSASSRASPSWPFYRKMDSLEIGAPSPNSDTTDDAADAADADDFRSRSVHHRLVAAPVATRVKREFEVENPNSGLGKRRRRGDSCGAELVSAIRMVGEGFLRMERMKMDMVRAAERMRMEMEMKRTEMILESQQRIVDSFMEGFAGRKGAEKDGLNEE